MHSCSWTSGRSRSQDTTGSKKLRSMLEVNSSSEQIPGSKKVLKGKQLGSSTEVQVRWCKLEQIQSKVACSSLLSAGLDK
jgi:hypothetical protein